MSEPNGAALVDGTYELVDTILWEPGCGTSREVHGLMTIRAGGSDVHQAITMSSPSGEPGTCEHAVFAGHAAGVEWSSDGTTVTFFDLGKRSTTWRRR